MTTNQKKPSTKHKRRNVSELVEEAAHFLPEQGPLQFFVHHNTLHTLEHLPFLQAVEHGSDLFGAEPYLSEEQFAEFQRTGRIAESDIETILTEESEAEDFEPLFANGPSRFQLRFVRLMNFLPEQGEHSLRWTIAEKDILQKIVPGAESTIYGDRAMGSSLLAELWGKLEQENDFIQQGKVPTRPRDLLIALGAEDPDNLVHPFLIRLAACYLDQGMSYWKHPFREEGFYQAFLQLYSQRFWIRPQWQKGLRRELRQLLRERVSPEQCIERVLERAEIREDERYRFLLDTLLSLRGWGGMIRQTELRPDRFPLGAPPAKILDYAAVQILLDDYASRYLGRQYFGKHVGHEEHRSLYLQRNFGAERSEGRKLELQYEAFCLAQLCGIHPKDLPSEKECQLLISEVAAFPQILRRRLLHLAYERHHRNEVLDAIVTHRRIGSPEQGKVDFQAVFCIDDREESLRRHLEELAPACQTYGYAGFFGVAMSYLGLSDVHPTPLCPVVITPEHLIREVSQEQTFYDRYKRTKKLLTSPSYSAHVGSHTLVRGTLFAQLFGLFSAIPLILRCLWPRFYYQVVTLLGEHALHSPPTKLVIERPEGDPKHNGYFQGYTISEMTDIVYKLLSTIGLKEQFSPIVLITGHGSSSLNNPHEAAHDCGATGGGRGGPNARAFALMANHPRVRAKLHEMYQMDIPAATWFVGSYHNTCDDSMKYYDQELIPEACRSHFRAVQSRLLQACMLDAHERCRRFEMAPPRMTARRALKHVEQHANDLAQPRPEYGHATNAVCVVGRRKFTRGLFMDRRAFLVSYDPEIDQTGQILEALLLAVGPVGAGINLEYYFSTVDPYVYGSGTKLPHNVTGLIGVMDGHSSDLRTGLPWQMVEIHEPVRLVTVVESEIQTLQQILEKHANLAELIGNEWIQFAALDPSTGNVHVFQKGRFIPYNPASDKLPHIHDSVEYYSNHLEHLPCAHIDDSVH